MQTAVVQMQQLQRQFQQLCQEMLGMQNTISQIANQLQQEARLQAAPPQRTAMQPYGTGGTYASAYSSPPASSLSNVGSSPNPSPYGSGRATGSVPQTGLRSASPASLGSSSPSKSILNSATPTLGNTMQTNLTSAKSNLGSGRQSEISTHGRQ